MGFGFTLKDIPYGITQYVDIVRFSKQEEGWFFYIEPDFHDQDARVKAHRGTYRFVLLVAGDVSLPVTDEIDIDYYGDWKSATIYDA